MYCHENAERDHKKNGANKALENVEKLEKETAGYSEFKLFSKYCSCNRMNEDEVKGIKPTDVCIE
jgi:hypothetical protein